MFGHNIICIQCLNESYKNVSGIYSLLDKNVSHFSIIQVIYLLKDIHNSFKDIHNSFMDIHNSFIDILNSFMDILK